MKTGIKVADAMTVNPIYVDSTTNLEECSKIMSNNHVGSLLVKDNSILTGVITEQDIVRKVVAVGQDARETIVSNIMVKEMTTISPEKDIYDALVLMKKLNIRQIPVMENEKMAGLLTLKDILKIEPQLFELIVEKFELREESRKPISRHIPSEGICQGCGEYAQKVFQVDSSSLCKSCKTEQEN